MSETCRILARWKVSEGASHRARQTARLIGTQGPHNGAKTNAANGPKNTGTSTHPNKLPLLLPTGFGHYLVSVAERDVDLLLMEEFHASDAFVSWFCAKLNLPKVRGDGAWHSVSDSDGETALAVRLLY